MSPVGSKWRMPKMCLDCPWNTTPEGKHLRASLGRRRVNEIERGLLGGEHFICHKTSDEVGNGTNLVCAGALEFQDEHGVSSNYVRVCENLDWIASERAKRKGKANGDPQRSST